MRRVSEFARLKGISPRRVYELVRNGTLPVQVLSDGTILLEESSMLWHPRATRPLSPRMAWAVLSAVDGHETPDLRSSERARVREHVQEIFSSENPAQLLAEKVSARSPIHRYRASSDDVVDLRRDARIRVSRVGSPGSGMTAGDELEAYISADDLAAVIREYLLDEDRSGNVRLRTGAPDRLGAAAVAADLADWGRTRETREANRILSRLVKSSR
ncbi:hypothetical protein SAMN04489806_2255 [Paramicrobacterium humi]|uniref:Helix-turn-helix domain-containing protein n=1 Tax=Paramicrobacterium humi TaxID=640635 RepID=A0A1H4NPR9_9MICO|nr:hypothetical protein [Microbacterium humi]SEB96838.1 hypothetical protein SAMN04489806_2255 [Microbacterium humi]